MNATKTATACLALLAAAATACTPDRAPEAPADAGQVAVQPAQAPASQMALSPETIDRLKQEYAVLRETPAPEPRPSADANPEEVPKRLRERLPERVLRTVSGEATFYADAFEGRRTASGIPFRQNQMVAAHRAFPFGTLLRVTNLRNDRSVNVRVVDRGPHGARAASRGTIIDLSRRAAESLNYTAAGRAPVRVEVLEWGEGLPRTS
ncbi:MAG TPA: septal ring lytic transglycosylase RlpA family protein [Longimicrobiaceae bacterium]|nr:septal ring lytic transglycosylase RlpA family protein [Longimicrobiaceae bacterium]